MAQLDLNPRAPAATDDHVDRLLSPLQRAEASAVTAHEAGGQVELQLGHFCNNRCTFCASGQLSAWGAAEPVPPAAVARALDAAAERAIRRVTFLGGEPTIQPGFLPSLAYARRVGFDDITIFTNGARAWDARFLDAVLAGGAVRWRISIQGADAAAHDAIVGRAGAFARIVRSLRALQARRQDVTVNMCLTTAALPALPQLADLVLDHGVRQLCIDMVRVVSTGERSDAWLRGIMPPLGDAAQALRALLQRLDARAPGFDVNLTHLPFCVMPEAADRIHHGGEPTVTFTADLAERQGAMDKYTFQAGDRAKPPACDGCVFAPRCTGVPHHYLAWHGAGELKAWRAEEVAALDDGQRAFVDSHRAAVEGIAAASGFDVVADPRQRRFALSSGGGTVWLTPAVDEVPLGLWPLARGRTWNMAWEPGVVPARTLAAAQRLARALDAAATLEPMDLARAARARRWLDAAAAAARAAPEVVGLDGSHGAFTLTWASGGGEAPLQVRVAAAPRGALLALQEARPDVGDPVARAALSAWLGALLRATLPPAVVPARRRISRPQAPV